MKNKVLQRQGAVDMVEAAIRSIANNGSIGLTSSSLVDAEAIATVAADWVSQLFGVIRLYHLGQACNEHEAKAAFLASVAAASCNLHMARRHFCAMHD